MKILRYMLIFVPISLIGEFMSFSETIMFVLSALAIIPLAGIMGEATEEISFYSGPRMGELSAGGGARAGGRDWAGGRSARLGQPRLGTAEQGGVGRGARYRVRDRAPHGRRTDSRGTGLGSLARSGPRAAVSAAQARPG